MIPPIRTVAPAQLPVSLVEAKAHLRVLGDEEDTLIGALIAAAVSKIDGWTGTLGRCLITQTWRQDFADFPGNRVCLPFPDVQSVVVNYSDSAGVSQVFAGSNFTLMQDAMGSVLVLNANASWPSVADKPNAVQISMVCGYGAATDVPAAIKMAILLDVGTLFENRESVTNDMGVLPLAYDALLNPFRRIGL